MSETGNEQEDREGRLQRGITEVSESLTGFDEIAIRQQFGSEPEDLSVLMQMRALVYVLLRRDKMPDPDAHKAVMNMPAGQIQQRFVEIGGPDEIFPDEPESPEGKGDGPHSSGLLTLPVSAS